MIRQLSTAYVLCLSLTATQAAAEEQVATLAASGPAQLVLDAWPAKGWVINRFENLVEIHFPESGLDMTASSDLANALGPKVKAVEIEARDGDTFVRLTLDCACPVELSGYGPGRLQLAVIDTPTSLNVERRRVSSVPAPSWSPQPVAKPPETANAGATENDEKIDVDEARARLLEQLMVAAEAGIVDLRPEHAPQPPIQDLSGEVREIDEVRENEVTHPLPSAESEEQISEQPQNAETLSKDLTGDDEAVLSASEVSIPALETTADAPYDPAPRCFDASIFVFPEIDGPNEFLEVLTAFRGQLMGEFDVPDTDVALDLARMYLSAGLPHEATAIARDFAPRAPLSVLLQEVAAVIEGKTLSARASVLKPDCEGDQALWRAVALAAQPDTAEAVLAAELVSGRSLERLPLDLREIAAARIGNQAVSIGNWDTARRMEAMAVRAVAGRKLPLGETLLLAARLADWNGEDERAWDLRLQARRSAPPHSDVALIELAETVLRSEKFLDATTDTMQTELGILARRERGTEMSAKAFELEARLHARQNGRDDVVDLLSEGARTGLLPDKKQVALLSDLIEETGLGELSRPVGLIYLEDPVRFVNAMEQSGFRHAVARSLTEMGLPGLAEPLLLDEDQGNTKLMAEMSSAFLATGDPRRALDVAQQMSSGQTKDGVMAAALAALGQAEGSGSLMNALAEDSSETSKLRHFALEQAVDAGVATNDLDAAMIAASQLLELDPTRRRAEELVMIALMADVPQMPVAAATILDRVAPGRSEQLALLFEPTMGTSGLQDHAEASDLLERMETEVQLLEGLLSDG
ncbi:MAG: hypothetical protein AB8B85_21045 [Paracoccaceae bacterium]